MIVSHVINHFNFRLFYAHEKSFSRVFLLGSDCFTYTLLLLPLKSYWNKKFRKTNNSLDEENFLTTFTIIKNFIHCLIETTVKPIDRKCDCYS